MVHKELVDYEPNAIALSPNETVVVIGCAGVSTMATVVMKKLNWIESLLLNDISEITEYATGFVQSGKSGKNREFEEGPGKSRKVNEPFLCSGKMYAYQTKSGTFLVSWSIVDFILVFVPTIVFLYMINDNMGT